MLFKRRQRQPRVMASNEQDLPIPPGKLIHAVAGTDDVPWFQSSGKLAASSISNTLERNGMELASLGAVLDFGCGVGRVLRHWVPLAVAEDGRPRRGAPAFHGTDYNPALIDWCRANLPFARFEVNPLAGPLAYKAGSFDLIYALSVFTHLTEPVGDGWVRELARVLRPGGVLAFSTHGIFHARDLPAPFLAEFEQERFVVVGAEEEGANHCAAFHPERYVRERMLNGAFEVVDYVPEGALGNPRQDLWLVRKR
jgi:SAM-dependent methyltransferase